MAKRGKVLRDPLGGPGLLIAEGRQYPFVADGIWKSDDPPRPGHVVDIEFDAQGKIAGITVIPASQLAREQEGVMIGAEKRRTVTLALALSAQSEVAQFIAASVLVLSWFFLTAISVAVPFTGTLEVTFWQLLRSLGAGAFGLLALIAITGPFIRYFWKDRLAALGGLLPLSLVMLTGILLVSDSGSFFAHGGNRLYQQLPKQTREELVSAISLGLGTYVSIGISVYFAVLSVKQFRESKQNEKKEIGHLQRAAA